MVKSKAHQSFMTERLCLDYIWAISSVSVTLFVSHCDKVWWLTIIIASVSESSFQFNFSTFLLILKSKHNVWKRHEKQFCTVFQKEFLQTQTFQTFHLRKKTRSTLLLLQVSLTDAYRHTCAPLMHATVQFYVFLGYKLLICSNCFIIL